MFQPLTHWQVVESVSSVGHEDGEYEDADDLIESVRPTCLALGAKSHPRHAEQKDNHQRTPPEASLHLYYFTHARDKQSAEEWIEQTGETHLKLVGRGTPAAHNGIGCPVALFKESRYVDVQALQPQGVVFPLTTPLLRPLNV